MGDLRWEIREVGIMKTRGDGASQCVAQSGEGRVERRRLAGGWRAGQRPLVSSCGCRAHRAGKVVGARRPHQNGALMRGR
jgi:hypothetical protein